MLAYLNAIAFHVFVILKFCYEFDPLSALVWPHVADTPGAYVINFSLLSRVVLLSFLATVATCGHTNALNGSNS